MAAPSRQLLGASGEEAAAAWLEARGYVILARNVRTRDGEIDLIVQQGATVAFVEVKSRTTARFGHPAEAVVSWKRRRLVRLALSYLHRWRLLGCTARFDVMAVRLGVDGRVVAIDHVADAFRVED